MRLSCAPRHERRTLGSAASTTAMGSMPVPTPSFSNTATNTSAGVLPAPAPRPGRTVHLAGTGLDRHQGVGKPEGKVLMAVETHLRLAVRSPRREPPPARGSPPGAVRRPVRHVDARRPASTMILAWVAKTLAPWECAIMRKPMASQPRSRANPKCWTAISASVSASQCGSRRRRRRGRRGCRLSSRCRAGTARRSRLVAQWPRPRR